MINGCNFFLLLIFWWSQYLDGTSAINSTQTPAPPVELLAEAASLVLNDWAGPTAEASAADADSSPSKATTVMDYEELMTAVAPVPSEAGPLASSLDGTGIRNMECDGNVIPWAEDRDSSIENSYLPRNHPPHPQCQRSDET